MAIEPALGSLVAFFALSLIPWAGYGMGYVSEKSTGLISTATGIITLIWTVQFIFAIDPASAMATGGFSLAFISAGIHWYFDIDPKGHGLLCWMLAVIVAIIAALETSADVPYFTAAMWSYVLILIAFGGGSWFGTDGWVRAFTILSALVGLITTGVFGILWAMGEIGF